MSEIEVGKLILSGWLPNGRQITFEQPSTGDLQRDISLAFLIDKAMNEAGLTPNPIPPGEGEKTETVHYILISLSENERGTSYKVFLYTERFKHKFLHIYLNNDGQVNTFEQAFGMDISTLPIYDGDAALERGKNPQKDTRYIVPCIQPVQVVYKPNPLYEGEEDKKHAKYVFVRWAGLSTQTDNRQTGQTGQTGNGVSDGRLSDQTDSRQTHRQQRRLPVENGSNRIEVVTEIVRTQYDNGFLIRTPSGAMSWTRDPFKPYINIGDQQTGVIPLGGDFNIISERIVNKKGEVFWKIIQAEPMGAAESEIFGTGATQEEDFPFGPPPEADFD